MSSPLYRYLDAHFHLEKFDLANDVTYGSKGIFFNISTSATKATSPTGNRYLLRI